MLWLITRRPHTAEYNHSITLTYRGTSTTDLGSGEGGRDVGTGDAADPLLSPLSPDSEGSEGEVGPSSTKSNIPEPSRPAEQFVVSSSVY